MEGRGGEGWRRREGNVRAEGKGGGEGGGLETGRGERREGRRRVPYSTCIAGAGAA